MKYAIIIPAGAADRPSPELDGLTPLAAARTPGLDRIATTGRQGAVRLDATAGAARSRSERTAAPTASATLAAILGCRGAAATWTEAQLRALAVGREIGASDLALRLDLVTTGLPDAAGDGEDGLLLVPAAEGLTTAEARALLADLAAHWREACPAASERLAVHVVGGAAHVAIDRGGPLASEARGGAKLSALVAPRPETIVGQRWQEHAPQGGGAEHLTALMEASRDCFERAEVNLARRAAGLPAVSMAWLSGAPTPGPAAPWDFAGETGLRACAVGSSDQLVGACAALGVDRIAAPDDGLVTIGRYAGEALERYDLVIVHARDAETASLAGSVDGVIEALEAIDAAIVEPLLARLASFGDAEADASAEGWRCMVVADRIVATDERTIEAGPVPFAMAGGWVRSVLQAPLSEASALASDLAVDAGHDLLEYFLFSGLKRARTRPRDVIRRA